MSQAGKKEDLLQRLRDKVVKDDEDASEGEDTGGNGDDGEDVNVEKEESPTVVEKEVKSGQAPPLLPPASHSSN